MKRVLALQHVDDDPPGYLGEILQEHDIAYDVVDVTREAIPDPTNYQALISMGGPQHVYVDTNLPYMLAEKAAFQRALEKDIAILGICLGGQILASALGADVSRHHMTELGFYSIPLTEEGRRDPLFAGFADYHCAFHWHEDIFALPNGALCLASNKNAPNQAFRYGKRAYGLQFHIELNAEIITTWLRFPDFAREIIDLLGEADAPARLEQEWESHAATYCAHTRLLFENFLHIASLL